LVTFNIKTALCEEKLFYNVCGRYSVSYAYACYGICL